MLLQLQLNGSVRSSLYFFPSSLFREKYLSPIKNNDNKKDNRSLQMYSTTQKMGERISTFVASLYGSQHKSHCNLDKLSLYLPNNDARSQAAFIAANSLKHNGNENAANSLLIYQFRYVAIRFLFQLIIS